MKWKGSLKNRIQHALATGPLSYPSLMRAVFPADKYPNAFNRSANGGPPGCAMVFGRAINQMLRDGWLVEMGNESFNCHRVFRLPRGKGKVRS